MPHIVAEAITQQLYSCFEREGLTPERARRLTELCVAASADGVPSHGVNFAARMLRIIRRGSVPDVNSVPRLVSGFGAIDRYDGQLGLGVLNAEFCMQTAISLAMRFGVGCVALNRTQHWGRAGSYGWLAAEANCLAICWTNTQRNTASWRGRVRSVGNNPLVLAVPGPDGRHLVFDGAMSQYSYGRLRGHANRGQPLPVVGGLDAAGNPTTDAAAILDGGVPWPMGFWKGSGLAIALDAFAAILSDGHHSAQIDAGGTDVGCSQIFIAFQPEGLGGAPASQRVTQIVQALEACDPACRYPGQSALEHRERSRAKGIWVDDDIWSELTACIKP